MGNLKKGFSDSSSRGGSSCHGCVGTSLKIKEAAEKCTHFTILAADGLLSCCVAGAARWEPPTWGRSWASANTHLATKNTHKECLALVKSVLFGGVQVSSPAAKRKLKSSAVRAKRTAAHRAQSRCSRPLQKAPSTTAQRLIAQRQLRNLWFKTANIGSASRNDGACTGGLKAEPPIVALAVTGAAAVKETTQLWQT